MPFSSTLHLSESLSRLGGLENIINHWVSTDGESGAAAILDPPKKNRDSKKLRGLRPNKLYSLMGIRNYTKSQNLRCKTLVCHNFAGVSALSDLIPHERLVVYLHTNSTDVWPNLLRYAPFADGIITSSKDLTERVKSLLGESAMPISSLEYPLDSSFFQARRPKQNQSLLIGYAGRLVTEQKRVERLAAFCQALDGAGVNYLLHIAGDGPSKSDLAKSLAPFPVKFLGPMSHNEMAAVFSQWDFQVITSDYETGPLSALEGMASGVIPIFPKIVCQAADLLMDQFQHLIYPIGDMQDAASRLAAIGNLSVESLSSLRSQLQRLVGDRTIKVFLNSADHILTKIHERPPIGKKIVFRPGWKDFFPLAARCRLEKNSDFLK